ncbi:conserved hypothetical protein [Treponema primitia ZAS-2]|uniref:AAA domain-containing protein n=1 Tax=Treponema primitia (strain ATCC BAA-887 / DSM 12427 / ZAS-2) TaxID=545694 RepID=F5YID7_TREPZ|nr:conserved hypothetical protein [Treponema primitia ZAS-2]
MEGLFIKKNGDLYINGSNAYLLSGELATLLTERYIPIEILPFSFSEYLAMKKLSNLQKPTPCAGPSGHFVPSRLRHRSPFSALIL